MTYEKMKPPAKVLIFHLSRYGYADYAAGMINHLPIKDYVIYQSKYHSVSVDKPIRNVRTYRNTWEFFINSFIVLPLLLWKIYKEIPSLNIKVSYFLGFHYWDLPLIWICKMRRIGVVYTVHDGVLHEGEDYFRHRMLQNACIRRANQLIFLTNFVKNETMNLLRLFTNATVIPHGPINIPHLSIEHKHSTRLKLLFLGRIGKYKGVELLLEALKSAENDIWECLTIAGKPLYKIQTLSNSKIRFIRNWLSMEEIADLINRHDVLILPYKSATQSGVITLGISAAIPMICTKMGGLPEQLAEDEAVWTEPDTFSLLEAIRFLSKNRAAYDTIHQCLVEKRKQFSWVEPANRAAILLSEYLLSSTQSSNY